MSCRKMQYKNLRMYSKFVFNKYAFSKFIAASMWRKCNTVWYVNLMINSTQYICSVIIIEKLQVFHRRLAHAVTVIKVYLGSYSREIFLRFARSPVFIGELFFHRRMICARLYFRIVRITDADGSIKYFFPVSLWFFYYLGVLLSGLESV